MLIKHKKVPTMCKFRCMLTERKIQTKWIQQSLYLVTEKSFSSNYIYGFSQAKFCNVVDFHFLYSIFFILYFPRFICMVDFKNQDQIKYATDEATENITNELKGKKFDYFRYRYVICFTDTLHIARHHIIMYLDFFSDMRGTHSVREY